DLEYWATGLTPVYLEGALARTLTGPARRRDAVPSERPAYDAPAASTAAAEPRRPVETAGLDPLSPYAQGEKLFRQQLHPRSAWPLRNITRAYDLLDGLDADLAALDEPELISLILSAVRVRA